jgi:predicted enzyme involved in methoxymalonyl-ACP biosynthesis
VLLAAVSKNDLETVRTALRDKEGMTLTEADFVRVVANWRPKHGNLVELAAALNVGLDSVVFVDDSPYECGLVRRELPAVTVVQVDGEPAKHVDALLRDGWFTVREVTAEDRTRVAKYQQELVRKDFLDSFESIEDYLRELAVTVRLAAVSEAEVPRVSQLTLRTNQFNLTTGRLQPADVLALLGAPDGVLVLRAHDDIVHVENFLLSCRVFSRGIEHACVAALLRHARSTGARAVTGTYRRSAKNAMVRDLYPRYGFTPVGDDGATATFVHDLATVVTVPQHIALTTDLAGDELAPAGSPLPARD